MSDSYITLWSQPQVEVQRRLPHGEALRFIAGGQFAKVGVDAGDRVYVVGLRGGRLLLLARFTVERYVTRDEATRIMGHDDLYEASDRLIGTGTPLVLDREVPEPMARRLERASGKRLPVAPDAYSVSPFALMATGKLTPDSAALLDNLF